MKLIHNQVCHLDSIIIIMNKKWQAMQHMSFYEWTKNSSKTQAYANLIISNNMAKILEQKTLSKKINRKTATSIVLPDRFLM